MSRRRSVPRNSGSSISPAPVKTNSMTSVEPNRGNSLRKKLIAYCSLTCVKPRSSTDHNDTLEVPTDIRWRRYVRALLVIGALAISAVILVFFVHPKPDTVCYIRVGCFSVSGPWSARPTLVNFVPQSPSVINTTFIVTSKYDPNGTYGIVNPAKFNHFGVVNEGHAPWNSTSLIVFLIHGYTDMSGTWMQTLKQAFLHQKDEIIVVLVDWQAGAAGYYPQVVANTRIVAKEITLFIRYIQRRFGRKTPKRIHLVGHSLGSQISSYVGKSFANSSFQIHQITALDPAYPFFEGYGEEIRLHKSDALHVLAIHSNIGPWGLGMKEPVGTVDIYLNNGRDQRGCVSMISNFKDADMKHEDVTMKVDNQSLPRILGIFSDLKDKLACSHRRAYSWLEDVLRDMAGILYVNHTHVSNPVVGYPVKWNNGTDILELTTRRAIQYSFCREHEDQSCWKLESNEDDAFFRLPSSSNFENRSLVYFIPTADRSPFCARFALLEIFTCPPTTHNAMLRGWHPAMRIAPKNNITVNLMQEIFDQQVGIYQGLLHHRPRIHAWVEFSCDELQLPAHLQVTEKNSIKRYLSVKLAVSLETLDTVSRTTSGNGELSSTETNAQTKSPELQVCASKMKLVYFNETASKIISLNWSTKGPNKSMVIPNDECIEVQFPL